MFKCVVCTRNVFGILSGRISSPIPNKIINHIKIIIINHRKPTHSQASLVVSIGWTLLSNGWVCCAQSLGFHHLKNDLLAYHQRKKNTSLNVFYCGKEPCAKAKYRKICSPNPKAVELSLNSPLNKIRAGFRFAQIAAVACFENVNSIRPGLIIKVRMP